MVHLLHRLYGVDAPVSSSISRLYFVFVAFERTLKYVSNIT